jgi:glycosyltransferase EpsH
MAEPLVTIVVPVYNASAFLQKSLPLILNQTYTNTEVLIINDGSIDDSLKKVHLLTADYPNVTVVNKNHTNAGDSRNVGLDAASGQYIMFLDCDDEYDAHYVEHMLGVMTVNSADVVFCTWLERNNQTGEIGARYSFKEKYYPFSPTMFSCDFYADIPFIKVYSVAFLKEFNIRFLSLQYANDQFFAFISLLMSRKTCYLDMPLVLYNRYHGSAIRDQRALLPYVWIENIKEIQRYLKANDLYEQYHREYQHRCIGIVFAETCKQESRGIQTDDAYILELLQHYDLVNIEECVFDYLNSGTQNFYKKFVKVTIA